MADVNKPLLVNPNNQTDVFKDNDLLHLHCIKEKISIKLLNMPIVSAQARVGHVSFPDEGKPRIVLIACTTALPEFTTQTQHFDNPKLIRIKNSCEAEVIITFYPI